jgi:hypothetical protein
MTPLPVEKRAAFVQRVAAALGAGDWVQPHFRMLSKRRSTTGLNTISSATSRRLRPFSARAPLVVESAHHVAMAINQNGRRGMNAPTFLHSVSQSQAAATFIRTPLAACI